MAVFHESEPSILAVPDTHPMVIFTLDSGHLILQPTLLSLWKGTRGQTLLVLAESDPLGHHHHGLQTGCTLGFYHDMPLYQEPLLLLGIILRHARAYKVNITPHRGECNGHL